MGPELMAYGFASGESYVSDLTLAYIEDIGHLIANYSAAGPIMDMSGDPALVKTDLNVLDALVSIYIILHIYFEIMN